MHATALIWRGVELIPDRLSRADPGQILITAVMLYAFRMLRSVGFARLSFKLA